MHGQEADGIGGGRRKCDSAMRLTKIVEVIEKFRGNTRFDNWLGLPKIHKLEKSGGGRRVR